MLSYRQNAEFLNPSDSCPLINDDETAWRCLNSLSESTKSVFSFHKPLIRPLQ